ncbi:MAG: MFS transporter [Gammaproteobacteria bacterium]|jgi:MFS family permease
MAIFPIEILRSLRHRNFRIYYLGQLVSLNGTWMQSVAQSWLIYRLTESGFLLGLTGTLTLLPNLIFGIYGGWLADRFPRQRLLIIVQALAMVQALVLGVLTVGGWVQPWHILILALALGLVQAVETPVRQSFISQLVEREDLTNAIALNSSMFHLARFIGPAIAGVLVAWVGEGPVFIINAVTFIAVLISLCVIRLPVYVPETDDRRGVSTIWSGFHYAWNHGLTRSLLMTVAAVSLFGGATVVLMPIFVDKVFDHGPQTLGVFMGMLGAGSLTAALTLAHQREFRLLERRVAVAAVSVALGLVVFALNERYVLALVILYIMGFSTTTVFASSNALIQLSVPDYLRGRTMALFTIALHGMVSLGQLMLGSLSDLLGAPYTAGLSGAFLLVLAILITTMLYSIGRLEDH